eukprot:2853460-Prorocentrum_lima.AAC.1
MVSGSEGHSFLCSVGPWLSILSSSSRHNCSGPPGSRHSHVGLLSVVVVGWCGCGLGWTPKIPA